MNGDGRVTGPIRTQGAISSLVLNDHQGSLQVSRTFQILTPDAQYSDDATVERQMAGEDAHWHVFKERGAGWRVIPEQLIGDADALVVWHETLIDQPFIDRLQRCKVIVRAGVGFDHIDLEAAARADIPVCNTPDYGTSEVADHALALLLALTRGITAYHEHLRLDPVGNYDFTRAPLVRRIRGTVMGIVGLGRIGTATALRAKAFGMRVIAYDPYLPSGTEIAVGVERTGSLEALLAASDVVSLHAPLTSETRGMIDKAALKAMKDDAILINTARGAIVDTGALIAGLAAGDIAGAGIDVLPEEPPQSDDPMALCYADLDRSGVKDRLILTPHAAWSSPESQADARRLSAETAILYLREGRLRNLVNQDELRRAGVTLHGD